MNCGQPSVKQMASLIQRSQGAGICRTCRETIRRQSYASLTAAANEHTPPLAGANLPVTTSAQLPYTVKTGVLLSRPPLITRDLTPFENAFYFYQRRLNERLALPFTRYFYFKKDTPADLEWKRKIKERSGTPARDIGAYNAYSKDEGWNDELLVGMKESEIEHQVEALLRDAEVPGIGSGEMGEAKREVIPRPASRITEADREVDERSLDRKLDRTLYLVVKEQPGRWRFPAHTLLVKESLHQAAERVIVHTGGLNMNTWVVGNAPIGHYHFQHPKPLAHDATSGIQESGEKTFFMKARIMAGQVNLQDNKLGLTDHKWLCKEEVEKAVSSRYWSAVRNMLSDR